MQNIKQAFSSGGVIYKKENDQVEIAMATRTNGTVLWGQNQLVNITVAAESYFNKTIIGWNTSENLQLNLSQTEITFFFVRQRTQSIIDGIEIILQDTTTGLNFSTSNGSITLNPVSSTPLNFTFTSLRFTDQSATYMFSDLEISNVTVNMSAILNVSFFDEKTHDFFDVSAPSSFRFQVVCPDEVQEFNVTNASFFFNESCDFIKLRATLFFTDETY